MRIPVTTTLSIEKFLAGVVTVATSLTKNTVFGKRPSGNIFATQRPGTNLFIDVSATAVTDRQGRGLYYWDAAGATYFVNNDTVYKTDYTGALGVTMTAGTERVEFFEVGDYLAIFDYENNEGWYIDSAADTTLVAISNANFPPNQTPALTLARGGAVLNKTLFAYCTNGQLWNSSVEDPSAWAGTDFIESEVNTDGGVMAYLHSNHIAAIGNRSIEFFYWPDGAAVVGSPLSVREDLVYDIGAVNYASAYADADQVTFAGLTSSGDVRIYTLDGLSLTPVSTPDLDSMLTVGIVSENLSIVGSGFSSGGRTFYVLTPYFIAGGEVEPVATYVYDSTMGWSIWELMFTDVDHYPVVSWTQGVSTRAGQGMLTNGDLITIYDDFLPTDTIDSVPWVEAGWVEDGWVSNANTEGTNIEMTIITGSGDFQTREEKYQAELRLVANITNTSQLATVQWSDNGNDNYNTGGTIDLSNMYNRLNRMGSFRTRNYKITYAGDEKVEIEAVEGDFEVFE